MIAETEEIHSDADNPEINPAFDFENNGISQDEIYGEFRKPQNSTPSMFEIRKANTVLEQAAKMPDPLCIYPHLIVENHVTILFADTGVGKTILAVQIATHIATYHQRTVLYVDLELSDKQFEKRYKNDHGKHFCFPDNFYRVGYSNEFLAPKGFTYESYFLFSLENAITETSAAVVVIDNFTKLSAGDTDSAKSTIPILNSLANIKRDRKLTLIVLEHNKKVDFGRPIVLTDLQGSKMKSNFADSVFSIGRSLQDKNIRYIKQLKVRDEEMTYDTENVMVCEIVKDDSFLQFKTVGYDNEYNLLKQSTEEHRESRKKVVIELKSQGFSNREIGKRLSISEGTVRGIIKAEESLKMF